LPFAPEVLAALADLKRRDKVAFETLRAQLKRAGCRVAALDEALSEEISGGPGAKTQTQADILLRLAQSLELFHAADMTAYADLDINGHRETWPVRSKGFARWLARAFYLETRSAAGSEAQQASLNVIEAKAHHDAIEREVDVRVERTREQRNANKERLRQERLRQGLPAHRVTCVPVTWVKKPGPPVKVGQPWKALGVSKSTYYRRVRLKAHEVLTDPGSSTGNRPS
jgi:hypothetical protein